MSFVAFPSLFVLLAPARMAPLSEGRMEDGHLNCCYHGWQFDGEGKCVKVRCWQQLCNAGAVRPGAASV